MGGIELSAVFVRASAEASLPIVVALSPSLIGAVAKRIHPQRGMVTTFGGHI